MPAPVKNMRSLTAFATPPANLDIAQLNGEAVRALGLMFNAERQLYCHRLRHSEAGLVQEGISHRYTLMTLLGLFRGEAAGLTCPINNRAVLGGLVRDTAWIENIGDLGLLLWTCAVVSPERLHEIFSRGNLETAFDHSHEIREGRTMELAWFLSGLAHARLALPHELQDLTDLAQRTYQLLRKNQGEQGIFGHTSRKGKISYFLRARVGSFADQVYPIYALSKFSQAYGVPTALEMATRCADAISRVQGTMGQWWWHYDAASGRAVEKYPVYSVHQQGMAPMALFALEEAGGMDYSESINRGLHWIAGHNELLCDLRHASGLVWRCLSHGRRYKVYLERAQGFLGLETNTKSGDDLEILKECRPYELGWLLYAFAGRKLSRALSQ
jgi:hypothetical protein